MNISYFRKSDREIKEVVAAFKKGLESRGVTYAGDTNIADGSILIRFFDAKRAEKIISEDPSLFGLVPMAALVSRKEGKTIVGIGNPQLLNGSEHFGQFKNEAEGMDKELRSLVNEAAGVGEPKIEKIKLYSTATCPYCKMEKSYLEQHKVPFELVMVDTDQAAAQEMVRKTGQMGVPVTEIMTSDGDSEFMVGFDKVRLGKLLKIAA